VAQIAALALIISALGPLFSTWDPPGRFHDYAHYIRSFHSKIHQAIEDHKLSDEQKHDSLRELTALARSNLDDVKNKWEWIEDRVNACSPKRSNGGTG